jgi:hypothetical protein
MSVIYTRLAPFCVFAQRRLVVADVSGQPISPVCKFRAAQQFFLDCLTLASQTDDHSTLLKIQEEHRSHLRRGGSLWSHMVIRTFVSLKDACLGVKDSRVSSQSSVAFTLQLRLQNNPK